MNIPDYALNKADPMLQEFLRRAAGDEVVRAVMTLGARPQERSLPRGSVPGGDRLEYRKAMIAQREKETRDLIGPIVDQLAAMALKPRGGATSPVVVVEGTAETIGRSLALDGVRHAVLDSEMQLITPLERPAAE